MNIERAKQLQIYEKGNLVAYGGDQAWYTSNTRAMGGCSSVAGVNSLRAFIRNNKELREKILRNNRIPEQAANVLVGDRPEKEDMEILMNGMYETMRAFEIFPLNLIYDKDSRSRKLYNYLIPNFGQTNTGFIIGIIRFAHRFGIDIEVNSLNTAFCAKDDAKAFIDEGLEKSGAVVIMTSYNKHTLNMCSATSDMEKTLCSSYEAFMKCHFATITDRDKDRLLLSTWGKPAIVDFNLLSKGWKSVRAFESTLFYIQLSSRKNAKKCMLNAYKVFIKGIVQTIIRKRINSTKYSKNILKNH